ncbi:hypothetical protein Trydic_g2411 [Trypoxylus dichotomus]
MSQSIYDCLREHGSSSNSKVIDFIQLIRRWCYKDENHFSINEHNYQFLLNCYTQKDNRDILDKTLEGLYGGFENLPSENILEQLKSFYDENDVKMMNKQNHLDYIAGLDQRKLGDAEFFTNKRTEQNAIEKAMKEPFTLSRSNKVKIVYALLYLKKSESNQLLLKKIVEEIAMEQNKTADETNLANYLWQIQEIENLDIDLLNLFPFIYEIPIIRLLKLELEDLEYVLSDGQNLIINPNSTGDDADEGNIVYTDGSRAVVLQTGVKHYIQTLGGETYLLGNDADNIEQLVINAENQSEESNGAIEYVEDDASGETVIYELADTDNENVETQPERKRFKIGDTEYVTLEDSGSLQLSNDDQFSVLNENSISETSNYQYAILKDGKLHLQLCNNDNIEVLEEDSIDEIQNIEDTRDLPEDEQKYIDTTDKIEEYVLLNTNLTEQNTVDLSKITGRDFLAGKTIVWDNYLSQMQYKINNVDEIEDIKHGDSSEIQNNNENYDQFLNRKLLIRKNPNGKSLFGKILHIQPAKKTLSISEHDSTEMEVTEDKQMQDNDVETNVDNDDLGTVAFDEHDPHTEVQQLLNCEDQKVDTSNSIPIEYNQEVTEDIIDFLTKTLYSSLDMPSLKEKLLDHRLEIKYVEKKLDADGEEINQRVHYISGHMVPEAIEFILDNSEQQKNVTSLTIISCFDPNNEKKTKVIFHEKSNIPELTNRNLVSSNTVGRHRAQNSDRTHCSVCQQKFANFALLNEHIKSTGHYFNCDKCNKRLTTYAALRRHQKVHAKHLLMHNRMKSYQCDICMKCFKTYGEMNMHRKFHNHHCEICGREFSRHSNLLRHTEIHKGEGNLYKCGICDCSYKFTSSLTRHVVQNHMKQ